MEDKDIRKICHENHLFCNKITRVEGSFNKEIYFIDDKYLIRTSKQSMLNEQFKFDRIRDLKHVPKIVFSSDQRSMECKIYYIILQYIQGIELFTKYDDLQNQDIYNIGVEIADFLSGLHTIKGEEYDIGHYVPIIPDFDKSWKAGHQKYWDLIYNGLKDIPLSDNAWRIIERSNDYINENISSMDFENGHSLIHNDFHFKNIIVNKNVFSGVIDWECSQYGEADFDLIHLLHWSLFPPSDASNMMQLFETVFIHYMKKSNIPMIEKRLTIYLLEHDCIQILWSQGKKAEELLPRIEWWIRNLEKYIVDLLKLVDTGSFH
ncbi:putative Predicted aminoglycoside phosphotransferase [Petrocella atlantisensis]|uniref:Putative Predicted aminoglycoside phosphotransferase n=1 Tax=Petrocella atlantisensis TaxID=2173034 RepID=A0A3P7S3F3_9FIRM|nr:aminoglycoside phosphotransferase family protein [Petrocella atlantisensis]VDN49142.1 putative Predicted aminoglycoside phosphotransferase [Petrocella atlantisensis]